MDWLNYHHLLYFHRVVKLGSISAASEELRLSQPTISKQIHELERVLGEKLLDRKGRGLVPTAIGRMVYDCAEQIFAIGREIIDLVKDRPSSRPLRLQIGVADSVPKPVIQDLLKDAIRPDRNLRLVVHEGSASDLLSRLALHHLDIIISDQPAPATGHPKAYNHPLGESPISFFAIKPLANMLKKGFPKSLHGIPAILPSLNCGIRLALEHWFEEQHIKPRVIAECDDHALVRLLGASGGGFFPAPKPLAPALQRSHGVIWLGDATGVQQNFYAITGDRRIKHPGILTITRQKLFSRK